MIFCLVFSTALSIWMILAVVESLSSLNSSLLVIMPLPYLTLWVITDLVIIKNCNSFIASPQQGLSLLWICNCWVYSRFFFLFSKWDLYFKLSVLLSLTIVHWRCVYGLVGWGWQMSLFKGGWSTRNQTRSNREECTVFFSRSGREKYNGCMGLSWWSSGSDSVFPLQRAQVQSLGRELDPTCCNCLHAVMKDPSLCHSEDQWRPESPCA